MDPVVSSLPEANDGLVGTGYFNSLSAALEVKTRTRAVNDKITYAAEVQSVLRQLLHEVCFLLCAIRKSMHDP